MKKTFENSNQEFSGVRHEREVMPFLILCAALVGIRKTFPLIFLEDIHAGKNRWDLVFYGVKSKLLVYYRLGSKDPNTMP